MDILSNLALGFGVAVTLQNLALLLHRRVPRHADRRAAGHRPGRDGRDAVAAHVQPAIRRPPMIMLAGIYYGAQYGGSTTAILVNIPGESSSVVTTIDGHQMAKQGRAGPALGIAAIASFIAGSVATLVVALFSPPLAEIALKFGPPTTSR